MDGSSIVQQCQAQQLGSTTSSDSMGGNSSNLELLSCITSNLTSTDERLSLALDFLFLLFSTTLVFFMQAGFAMLCAGSVRLKNVQNSMLKNLLDACGAALGFWTFGYSFAYSPATLLEDTSLSSQSFIGRHYFLLTGLELSEYPFWLFQFAFAATSATIVAGTLAERCQMIAYLFYSLVLTGFVYPVVVRAIWSEYGILNRATGSVFGAGSDIGMIDFAGSGVVHVTGGATALLATWFLGPRRGRFYDFRGREIEDPKPFPGHSAALQVLGTFSLWFGWYGFNCGSILTISTPTSNGISSAALISSLAAVNTTLSASGGCVAALFTRLYLTERRTGEAIFDLVTALNGTLAVLVAITAGCAVVEPWASLVIGIISGWVYLLASNALIAKKLDDAVDAIPVHLANGIWGCFAVGLFATPRHLDNLFGSDANAGCFYEFARGNSNFKLLGVQVLGILFIVSWVILIMTPFFLFLNYVGWFRADSLEEVVGLDVSYHGYSTQNTQETVNEEYFTAFQNRKKQRNPSFHSESQDSDKSFRAYEAYPQGPSGFGGGIGGGSSKMANPVLSILKESREEEEPRLQSSSIDQTYEETHEQELEEEIAAVLGNEHVHVPTGIEIPKAIDVSL